MLRSFKTFYHIVLSCTLFADNVLVYIFATKNLKEKIHSQIWPYIGFCRELNSLQDALYKSSRFFDLKKCKVKNYKKSVFRTNKLGISMGSQPRLHRPFPNLMKLPGFVDHVDLSLSIISVF
jgi:hypothetical protein